jgi:hypothetical protein
MGRRVALFCRAVHRHVGPPVGFDQTDEWAYSHGWSKTFIGSGQSVVFVTMAIFSPVADTLADRCCGARAMLTRRPSCGGGSVLGFCSISHHRSPHHGLRGPRRHGPCHSQHAPGFHHPCQVIQGKSGGLPPASPFRVRPPASSSRCRSTPLVLAIFPGAGAGCAGTSPLNCSPLFPSSRRMGRDVPQSLTSPSISPMSCSIPSDV